MLDWLFLDVTLYPFKVSWFCWRITTIAGDSHRNKHITQTLARIKANQTIVKMNLKVQQPLVIIHTPYLVTKLIWFYKT